MRCTATLAPRLLLVSSGWSMGAGGQAGGQALAHPTLSNGSAC